MPEEIKEKVEFLGRQEVRTMQKDIARLREKEARRERERIARLKTEEEVRIERERIEKIRREAEERRKAEEETRKEVEVLKEVVEEKEKRKGIFEKPLLPPLSFKKPSLFEKIFIRVAIIILVFLILLNLFLFWYWYLKETPPQAPSPSPLVEEIVPKEVIIPPSLISVETTETLEISNPEELRSLLSQILERDLVKGQFIRILIKNKLENKILGLKEFYEVFEIKTPENFYQKLENDFTLFIYPQKEGKRLGFVSEIKEKEGFSELLKSWESTIEKDFKNLFILLGQEKPALVPYFKEEEYKNVTIKFQTISTADLGICYGIFDKYFIFTTSWESIKKVIDKLVR